MPPPPRMYTGAEFKGSVGKQRVNGSCSHGGEQTRTGEVTKFPIPRAAPATPPSPLMDDALSTKKLQSEKRCPCEQRTFLLIQTLCIQRK